MFNLHNLSSRKLHLLSQRNDFSFTSFLDEKYSFRVFFGPSFFPGDVFLLLLQKHRKNNLKKLFVALSLLKTPVR